MPEPFRVTPRILSDPRIRKLIAMLVANTAQEMQNLPADKMNRPAVRQRLAEALGRVSGELPAEVREQVLDSALAEMVGYGPLELLLKQPDLSEIMVNGAKSIFVERNG